MINHDKPITPNSDPYDKSSHYSSLHDLDNFQDVLNNLNPEESESEKTEVWQGQEMAMAGLLRTMSRVKYSADVVGDSLSPSFSMGVRQIRNGYDDFKKRNVKIRFITEITKDNLSHCKELVQYVELRHIEGLKGNMAVSETEYVATAKLAGEAKPVIQTIYSNVKAVVEQHKYFFDNLWKKATPAEQRIMEIEKGLLPVETRIIDSPEEIYALLQDITEKSNNGLSNCSTIGGFQMIYEDKKLFQSYSNLLTRSKEGKAKGGVRWITHIEDKNGHVDLINNFLNIGIEIRHTNNLPPISFALSDKQFQGTIEKMEHGKMFKSILYSTEPSYVKHFQSIFEEIWRNGINAQHRISQIEKGIASETTSVIENPTQAKGLVLSLIDNAKEEIMIVLPSFNAVIMQNDTGVISSLKQKSQENLRIRILSPINENVNKILQLSPQYSKEKNQGMENIFVREIVKQQNIKSMLLMVDNKYLLAVELKDDSKEVFEHAIGLATYSTSKPTLLSYISIFESLWTQTEMYENLKIANEKLETHDKMQQDFINNAAHELRTPSQAISGYTELALLDYDIKDKDKNIRYLEIILRNAERLTRLTEKILSVARIESKILKIDNEFFNLDELISNIIEEFDSRLKKLRHKDIEFVFEKNEKKTVAIKQKDNPASSSESTTTHGSFLVKADKEKIEQVIVNLLDNAIKFTKEKIFVKITETASDIVVEVKDFGPGIDQEILPNIFSKFVSKSDAGTGLGLYISKSIIEAHGGSIWAQNNDNGEKKGSVFSFSLPK